MSEVSSESRGRMRIEGFATPLHRIRPRSVCDDGLVKGVNASVRRTSSGWERA